MQKKSFRFSNSSVAYYMEGSMAEIKNIVDRQRTVLLTDETVFGLHGKQFKNWNTIVLKAGEEYKVQATVDSVVEQLIEM